VDIGYIYFLTL